MVLAALRIAGPDIKYLAAVWMDFRVEKNNAGHFRVGFLTGECGIFQSLDDGVLARKKLYQKLRRLNTGFPLLGILELSHFGDWASKN